MKKVRTISKNVGEFLSMKRIKPIGWMCLLGVWLVACQKNEEPNVVRTSFFHPYGPQVDETEWKKEGCSGETAEMLLSGIELRREYEGGVLHGSSTWTFPHSRVVEHIEEYEYGKKVATIFNYSNGSPKIREDYEEGGITLLQGWYEDGVPRYIEETKNGLILQGTYFTFDGDVEGSITAGNGTKILRDDCGVLLEKSIFASSEMVEKSVFYKNGHLREKTCFTDGKKHGEVRTYTEDGVPLCIEMWKGGRLDGKQTYFENGSIARIVPYQNGLRHGIELRYKHGTDEVVQEIAWDRDQRHGCTKNYFIDQVVAEWYWNGNKVTQSQFEQWDKTATVACVHP